MKISTLIQLSQTNSPNLESCGKLNLTAIGNKTKLKSVDCTEKNIGLCMQAFGKDSIIESAIVWVVQSDGFSDMSPTTPI